MTTCNYCGGEMLRVALGRRARAKATEEKEQASLSLYQAMREIAERRRMLLEKLSVVPFVLPTIFCFGPIGLAVGMYLLITLGGC